MKNRIQVAAACCALLVAMPGVAMISPHNIKRALEEQQHFSELATSIQNRMLAGRASDEDAERFDENSGVISTHVSSKKKVSSIYLTSAKMLGLFSAGALMGYGLRKGGISHNPYLSLILGGSLVACLGVYEAVKAYKQGTANNHKTLRQ